MKNLMKIASLTVFAVLFASTAKADAILQWTYTVSPEFASWTDTNKNEWQNGGTLPSNIAINSIVGGQEVRWKDSQNRYSSISIVGNSGKINTDGNAEKAMTISHRNATITSGTQKPYDVTLSMDIILESMNYTGENGLPVVLKLEADLPFLFYETVNDTSKAKYGTDDDLFVVLDPSAVTTGTFTIDGLVYDVTLEASFKEILNEYDADGKLIAAYADMARDLLKLDADTPIYGWTTKEGETNANAFDIYLNVRQSTIPTTPEPATMMIFGLAGLAGLPFARRLRKRA